MHTYTRAHLYTSRFDTHIHAHIHIHISWHIHSSSSHPITDLIIMGDVFVCRLRPDSIDDTPAPDSSSSSIYEVSSNTRVKNATDYTESPDSINVAMNPTNFALIRDIHGGVGVQWRGTDTLREGDVITCTGGGKILNADQVEELQRTGFASSLIRFRRQKNEYSWVTYTNHNGKKHSVDGRTVLVGQNGDSLWGFLNEAQESEAHCCIKKVVPNDNGTLSQLILHVLKTILPGQEIMLFYNTDD